MKLICFCCMCVLGILLAGCCPGGCFIATGKDVEALINARPYLLQWAKADVTPESRRMDSRTCGSDLLETVPYPDGIAFSQDRIQKEQQPREDDRAAYSRLFDNWQRCMLKKGYRYTGQCYDNEISRALPACGAP
ncbi:hypothetical protein [Silvimonas iriomotensis]|uniref:Lipoprotein n=1 Tax=Silvimonas iriomotensis TaxID=449662 RepID=A0ABQ2PCR8_9NEIS|nr:hypothetical protein [Silvimonas iriomotensis]GGP23017.1 hypothetical protein GCM10010970_30170 [Silvimonas iriomotensis]